MSETEQDACCPYIKSCVNEVTKHVFFHICNTPSYSVCKIYAKQVNDLNTPMGWLQKMAVEAMKMKNHKKTERIKKLLEY